MGGTTKDVSLSLAWTYNVIMGVGMPNIVKYESFIGDTSAESVYFITEGANQYLTKLTDDNAIKSLRPQDKVIFA